MAEKIPSTATAPFTTNSKVETIRVKVNEVIDDIELIGPLPGPEGPPGADGLPGVDGADGLPGVDGADGLPGADGAEGLQGEQGVQGVQGIQGIQGPPGVGAASAYYWPDPDDTAALQALFDVGGIITLDFRRHYRVSPAIIGNPALNIFSNTTLDLNDSTIEMKPFTHSIMFRLATANSVTITNGTIIGNGTKQLFSDLQVGIRPTIYATSCTSLNINNLEIRDAYYYGMYISFCDSLALDEISVYGSVGGGIHIVGNFATIGDLDVFDVTFLDTVNAPGNSYTFDMEDSTFGRIFAKNCSRGIKFQGGSKNLTIDQITSYGGPNDVGFGSPYEKLLKFQGTPITNVNDNITVNKVFCEEAYGNGLYIYGTTNLQILEYHGFNNGKHSYDNNYREGADILVIESDLITFNAMTVQGYRRQAIWLHQSAGTVYYGTTNFHSLYNGGADVVVLGGQFIPIP